MSMFEIHGGFTGLAASSRVRLARNIKGYPFRLTEQQHSEIADKIFAALKENPTIGPEFDKKQIIPRSTEASQLVEEHLISPELAQNGGWLIVSKDSGVSIMVGEEDHLRLQVIGTGLCPKECLETANRVASLIEAALPFAYDERLGYLTACPTNIGTGLRASPLVKNGFYGLRPASAGLIFGAMLEVFAASLLHTENWSGIASLGSVINVPAIIIFLVLSLGIWKLKKLHPIVFILIGAVCGIVFNL